MELNINPRFVSLNPLLIVGMREPLGEQSAQSIPILWKNFSPYLSIIPHRVSNIAYGLCVRSTESSNGLFYYMAGCEVSEFGGLSPALSPIIVPAQEYAVFSHKAHLSRIRETIDQVFDVWLPRSNRTHDSRSIHFFERYGEGFDVVAGEGDVEIWLPLVS